MHVTCMNHACYMNGIQAMNVPCMIHACMVQLLKKHSAMFKFLVQKPVCKEHKLKTILCSQQIHSTMRRQYQVASKSKALYNSRQPANLQCYHSGWLASQPMNPQHYTCYISTSQPANRQRYTKAASQQNHSAMYTHCTSYPVAQLNLTQNKKKLYCLQQSSLRLASSSVKVQH